MKSIQSETPWDRSFAVRLWDGGLNTLEIAKLLHVSEATIYNTLPMLRRQAVRHG